MAITKTLSGHGDNTSVSNWISQINVGNELFDLATHHSITFVNGEQTEAWNGLTDLEVVIPTLDQLVSSPIVFAGTVGSNGTISWADGYGTPAQKGYLLYITADCTFDGQACEAGDMAVCTGVDGSKNPTWAVISGENQVTILAGATPAAAAANQVEVELSATAKAVLDVEGKELILKLPASLVKSNLGVAKASGSGVIANDAVAAVEAEYITLTYAAAAQDTTLGQNKTIALPSALADGTVNISGDTELVKPSDIAAAWTPGTDGAHQSAAVEFAISGNVDLTAGSGNDFVTGWTPSTDSFVKSALKSASLSVVASANRPEDETIAVNPFLSANPTLTNDATLFATGIETVSTGEDFIIPGAVSISAETSKAASNGVITDVTFPILGDASSSTDVTYAAADAATGVIASIADPTVTINGGSVVASASVSNNVLVITPGTVTATASQGAVTYKKAQYVKTTVTTSGSVEYGSLQTAAGQGYKLSKQAVNATLTPGAISYFGLSTADVSAADKANAYVGLTATTGAYTAALASDAKGNIAAGTVITSVTDASVPVLGTVSATGSITAALSSTALTTSNVTVAELSISSLNIGSYSLGVSDTASTGAVGVGKAGNAQVTGSVTIASNQFVSDVYADADLAGTPAIADSDKVSVLS
jgi:hypothetical protein